MDESTKVAVVGAGLMGHGIAQVFATAGARVSVYDPDSRARTSLRGRVAENLRTMGSDPAVADRIWLDDVLHDAVADADWVFEAAPERLELKQQIFADVDALTPPDAILASNTSVMAVREVGSRVRRPERMLGTHWWNPPHLVPLVEVVRTPKTSDGTLEATIALLRTVGKTPVQVQRDIPGFVGNRLQHALWREAFALVDAGVCDPETIDTVVKQGFGMRLPVLGPMENADLVGLDLTLAIHEYLLPALTPPSAPSQGLRKHVAEGELGMRTGHGWRTWDGDQGDVVHRRLVAHLAQLQTNNPTQGADA